MLNNVSNDFRKIYNRMAGRIYRFLTLRLLFPAQYRRAATAPVNPSKVIFCEVRSLTVTDNFKLLIEKFNAEGYEVECHFLGETLVGVIPYAKNALSFLKSMATAKYVFVNDACQVTSCVKKRPETVLTQLWHACGAFKKFGCSTAELRFGVSREQMEKYPYYKNLNYITVSSPEICWAYEEAMNAKGFGSTVLPLGVSRTDVFFQPQYRQQAQENLLKAVPMAAGKKIMLYAPTFRGTVRGAKSPDQLDLALLQNALQEDWILLIKHHPFVKKPPEIPEQLRQFAIDVSGKMTIEDLLTVSDLCISDYSSLVFEYSLFLRPLVFFAPDIADYEDWRGFYYDYHSLTPGPVVTTTQEVLQFVINSGKFDDSRVAAFRNRFMSACDGHATDRIFDYLTQKGN